MKETIQKISRWIVSAPQRHLTLLIVIIFAVYVFRVEGSRAALANELKTAQETLKQIEIAEGVFYSRQEVVQDLKEDLLDQFDKVFDQNADLKREIKKSKVTDRTDINVKPPDGAAQVTETTPSESPVRKFQAEDRFSRFEFDSQGNVGVIQHAPYNISVVSLERDGIRKQLAIVTGGWDNGPLKEVEIDRLVLEEPTFKPYFSAEIFAGTKSAEFIVKRHINPWLSYGGGVGYNYDSGELSYGIAASLNLFIRPR